MIKNSPANTRDPDLIHGPKRSPGEGNGYPLQYSCWENSTDRGAWWAKVHRVTKSQTLLSELNNTNLIFIIESQKADYLRTP